MNDDVDTCSHCHTVLTDYSDVGYDGPAHNGLPTPEDERCDAMMEWLTLCKPCAEALNVVVHPQ